MRDTDLCPCGTGGDYRHCCGPLHRGEAAAESAEALMRSRYSAHAVGDTDYLWRSWHPRTRPPECEDDPDITWTGLEIVAVRGGGPTDRDGEVEFRAHYRRSDTGPAGARWVHHERSRFVVRAGRWFYLEGDELD